jgi:hypothetical protein
MKYVAKISVLIVLLSLLFISAYGRESVGLATGNLTTAEACGFGLGYTGLILGYGDEASCIGGYVTYGFSNYTEGRIKIGFSDLDGPGTNPEFLFGLDLKYKFMDYRSQERNNLLDLAFTTLLEYVNYPGSSVFELGGGLIGSIPFHFSSGHSLVPYSRLSLRWERYSAYQGYYDAESNYRVGLNTGVKYDLTSGMNLYGEFQLDGNSAVFLGLEILSF